VSYFSNQAGSTFDLWSKRADGSGQPSLLLDRESVLMEPLWSPNSEWLVYSSAVANNGDLEATRSDGTGTPLPVAATSAAERAPTFSPDGRYVAYSSNEAGLHEVYVVPFPDAGTTKWAVSAGGGSEPVWSRASGEIFYRNLRGEMVTVSVNTSPTFSAGTPTVLFDASGYRAFLNHRHYDVTPDGERFIMLRPLGEQGAQWILALNFFEVLRERVPD
jgi:serine/threonine-protein kinase